VTDAKPGPAAALTSTGAGDPPIDSGEQPALFDLPSDRKAAPGPAVKTGLPGRPAGSPNKRTEAWTNYLLAQYRSPLEAMTAAFNQRTGDLAAALGLVDPDNTDLINLFKAQVAAAVQVAPYLHAKQPTAVDLNGSAAVMLHFAPPALRPGEIQGDDPAGFTLDLTPADVRLVDALAIEDETEEIQGLSDDDPE